MATHWLQDLRDIHVPAVVEPAGGGYWLPWLALALLLALAMAAWPRWMRLARRRHALRRVRGLRAAVAAGMPTAQACAAVSVLIRRTALRTHQPASVAALEGSEWLSFLDRTGGDGAFARGPGAALATAPYERHPRVDTDALFAACERWLDRNA